MKEDDSDNDEGFVPTKVQIKADNKLTPAQETDNKKRPQDFQSRYIFGQGMLKKQPLEVYNRFEKYLDNQSIKQNNDNIWIREEPNHPYQKYIQSNEYTLVYSRYKEKIGLEYKNDDFTSNQMNLEKILAGYDKDHYSMLKNFQHPQVTSNLDEKQLEFDSRFEGGNLMYAFKSKQNENQYSLFLQNDTNTNGYNQWFYFSLRYAKPGVKYRFKIVNLRNRHSFFKENMKIAVFSRQDALNNNGVGWSKIGNNIKYERSPIRKFSDKKYKFYCLCFELTFAHQDDFLSIAMNQPYTYSRLMHHLNICENLANKIPKLEWKKQAIAHSISNNAVPYITITSRQKDQQLSDNQCEDIKKQKKVVLFLARQHPGETWSSFLMEEIMYSIVENYQTSLEIKEFLDNNIIKIFPMVNVDGVIYGNFRCDIGGFDLNRNWKDPDRILHPQVFAIKEQVQKIQSESPIQCVFDLHGHSKQYNIFCYSCKNDNLTCRVLPYMMSQSHPFFYFPYCTFGISKYKQTTARAVIYQIIENQNVLTIQNSFYGAKIKDKVTQFQPYCFKEVSKSLLEALSDYLQQKARKAEAIVEIKKNLRELLAYQKKTNGNGDSGSQSDPFADQMPIKQKIKKILPKSLATVLTERFQEDNIIKKKLKPNKKEKLSLPDKKKYETVIPKVQKPKKSEQQEQMKKDHNKTFMERVVFTQYKHSMNEPRQKKQRKPLFEALSQQAPSKDQISAKNTSQYRDFMQKSPESSLPFYLRDKPTLVPIKLKNDSLEMFKDAYEYDKKQKQQGQQNSQYARKTIKGSSNRKLKMVKRDKKQERQEFPLLCVLSQSKKKSHIDKYYNANGSTFSQSTNIGANSSTADRSNKNNRNQKNAMFKTYVHNEKLQRIRKNNQRQRQKAKQARDKNNASLISKVWRDNVARYGKNLNVFLGDIKGL